MLKVENISKSFYRKTALDSVSMHVHKGEVFGLLGPNGAGKTTLIRIINQIIEQDSGTVRLNGNLMTQQHLATIGYMPEERGLYKSMTVENHAILLGQLRGLNKHDVKIKLNYWLDKFQIADWKKKRIEELSKGMAQKVQFICTVLHEPDLLILDEPYSGFDPVNVELIKQELVEMRAKGKTIILSTHNMKSVEEVCDSVALIHDSKKVLEGRVSDLQEELKTGEYEVKFRGNMIAFVNALWTGFEIIDKDVLAEDLFVVRLKMRGTSTFDDLLNVLIGQVQIQSARELMPSMQDVFMNSVSPKSVIQ
jgi:ABC-2 type transport system ATP-binding protein